MNLLLLFQRALGGLSSYGTVRFAPDYAGRIKGEKTVCPNCGYDFDGALSEAGETACNGDIVFCGCTAVCVRDNSAYRLASNDDLDDEDRAIIAALSDGAILSF